MPGSGYRTEAKTFFICEGVTHYLSASAVDAAFRYVSQSAADPAELPQYLAARGLILIEDVGASTYRERFLIPL